VKPLTTIGKLYYIVAISAPFDVGNFYLKNGLLSKSVWDDFLWWKVEVINRVEGKIRRGLERKEVGKPHEQGVLL